MKYLFIGAHQDDIEFSCGGTILRLIAEGDEVYIAVITNGAASLGAQMDRKAEQRRACEYAGATKLITLGYVDGAVSVNARTVGEIARMIAEIEPDVVFTHFPDDSHQDHRAVAAMVRSATRRNYDLIYYDSYSSENFKPNLYVDITQYVAAKKELLGIFKSQIEKYKDRGIDFIGKSVLIAKLNGYECNAPYAEGFAIDTYTI